MKNPGMVLRGTINLFYRHCVIRYRHNSCWNS